MPDREADPLTVDVAGHRECLLGNEAIVRGAIEAGVAFATGYPGTPSSEVTDSFARISKHLGIEFEYAVNEKIALELAFAASLAGARSICAMKHLGLMYAGDPLSTIPYVGTRGGMVIVSAGDPSCRTSPNEQDQRLLAPMLHLPVLDPSTPHEAYRMTRFAFELSEKCSLPVVMRPTTRVCHSRAVIEYGQLGKAQVSGFERDPTRFVPIPVNARRLRKELTQRVEKARRLIGESEFFQRQGSGSLAILASGAPAAACADLIAEKGLAEDLMLLTLGAVYPLPEDKLLGQLGDVERLLVVEELSPYLEDAVRSLCARNGLAAEVLGKRTGHLPIEFEYEPAHIAHAIHSALGLGAAPAEAEGAEHVPPRPPSLCPGCPHRASQFALRAVFGEESIYFNDIGCYTLGYGPPLQTADALLCMGAGFTLAEGVSRMTSKRTVGIMGDSTFFHSGLPALVDAIKQDANMVAVILDNHVTGMTGFQESPSVKRQGDHFEREVSIESVARSLGARQVETVDPYDLAATLSAFTRAREARGLSVVVCERTCPVHLARETGQAYQQAVYEIDQERCRQCSREAYGLRCEQSPAEAFESHLARSRALERDKQPDSRPSEAPCSLACPLGLCVQGYSGHIAAGDYQAAYEMITSRVPLPESVCRVCHHPCETACLRTGLDEPVAINDLKRFVVDWARRENITYDPLREDPNGMRVAVVGAGPAGLAAAHDLALRGYEVTLFDAADKPGGLLRSGIPAYRLPADCLERDIQRILSLGVQFEGGHRLGHDLDLENLFERGYAAVYLAIGAGRGLDLGVPVSDSSRTPAVVDALTFLDEVCATEAASVDGKVVVVGGGNAALDAARAATRLGAEKVTVAYRRQRSEMPAIEDEIEAAIKEGIELRTQLMPSSVEPGGLKVIRTEPGERDASGRFQPVPVAGSEELVEADTIVAAVGQVPDGDALEAGAKELECTVAGLVEIDHQSGQSSHELVFAGGDLVPGSRTVTEAIATGQRAARGIDARLRSEQEASRRPAPPIVPAEIRATRPGIQRADRVERQAPAELEPGSRRQDFEEVVTTLTEAQARREASRCMVCGTCANCRVCLDLFGCPAFFVKEDRIHIDPELCMGCGVCADLCPNGAIRLVSDAGSGASGESALGPIEAPAEEMDK